LSRQAFVGRAGVGATARMGKVVREVQVSMGKRLAAEDVLMVHA